MTTALRRLFGRIRRNNVRWTMFERRPRVRPGPLPNLDAAQQAVYDRACRFLTETYRPVTGEKSR